MIGKTVLMKAICENNEYSELLLERQLTSLFFIGNTWNRTSRLRSK